MFESKDWRPVGGERLDMTGVAKAGRDWDWEWTSIILSNSWSNWFICHFLLSKIATSSFNIELWATASVQALFICLWPRPTRSGYISSSSQINLCRGMACCVTSFLPDRLCCNIWAFKQLFLNKPHRDFPLPRCWPEEGRAHAIMVYFQIWIWKNMEPIWPSTRLNCSLYSYCSSLESGEDVNVSETGKMKVLSCLCNDV